MAPALKGAKPNTYIAQARQGPTNREERQVLTSADKLRSLRQIRSFCRTYRGEHATFFDALDQKLQTLPTLTRLRPDTPASDTVDLLYQEAIGSLLFQAAPGSRQDFDALRQELSQYSESGLRDIEIVSTADGDGDAGRSVNAVPRQGSSLRRLLPPHRLLNDEQRAILEHFRAEMGPPSALFRQGGRDGEQN